MRRYDPHSTLRQRLAYLLKEFAPENSIDSQNDIPKKWERFDDVGIIPQGSFGDSAWSAIPERRLWEVVADSLGVSRLYMKGEVRGGKRRPEIECLFGAEKGSWVVRKENGIYFGYDIEESMWSAGNVNERKRMGDIVSTGEVVLDLFAGIGYYTIPILKSDSSIKVISCEWNIPSVEALEWNLKRNKCQSRCSILIGDCLETVPKMDLLVDRVVMGLLPDSTFAIQVATNALSDRGGFIHMHGLSPSKGYSNQCQEWLEIMSDTTNDLKVREASITRVKSYAPNWDHVVLNVELTPNFDIIRE